MLEFTLMPNLGDRDCRNRLEEAYESLQELIDNEDSDTIANRFNLCEPLDTNNHDDIASLYELSVRALINYLEIYQ